MQGISGITQSMSSAELEMAYQARVISLQKSALNAVGDAAIKLIQSATVLPNGQGGNLDVSA